MLLVDAVKFDNIHGLPEKLLYSVEVKKDTKPDCIDYFVHAKESNKNFIFKLVFKYFNRGIVVNYIIFIYTSKQIYPSR